MDQTALTQLVALLDQANLRRLFNGTPPPDRLEATMLAAYLVIAEPDAFDRATVQAASELCQRLIIMGKVRRAYPAAVQAAVTKALARRANRDTIAPSSA